jgi:6-phosphogluconolactonase
VVTPDGKFAYTDNAGTSNISGFLMNGNGTLTPLPFTIQAANPEGSTYLDMAIAANGKFLYTLNAGTGRVGIFAINESGTLTNMGAVDAVDPKAGANGIAAF